MTKTEAIKKIKSCFYKFDFDWFEIERNGKMGIRITLINDDEIAEAIYEALNDK